jgi:hypothetical protein
VEEMEKQMEEMRKNLVEMKSVGRSMQTELFTMAVRLLEES